MNQNFRHSVSSLYVGDLHPDVTDAELQEFLKKANTGLTSVKICRDHFTNRSLCYAYANFTSTEEAERTMEIMNGETLMGRTLRIMWSQRDPSLRRSGIGNVYIQNLSSRTTTKDLFDFFSQFGNILSYKIATDENGVSKGYGFVHFEHPEASERAVQEANNEILCDNKITVVKHISYRDRQAIKDSTWTNVYVRNLSKSFTEERLKSSFQEFGTITSIFLKDAARPSFIDPDDDTQPLKFGFVNFSTHDEAVKAVETMNGVEFDGLALYVVRARSRRERDNELKRLYQQSKIDTKKLFQNVNLYVKNIQDDITEDRLRAEFSKFGKIHCVRIKVDESKKPCGFGFVCFTTPEDADAAIKGMHNQYLAGTNKPLYVAHHQPKEYRHNLRNAHLQFSLPINAYSMAYPQLQGNKYSFNLQPGLLHSTYNRSYQQQQQLPYAQRPGPNMIAVPSKTPVVMQVPIPVQNQLHGSVQNHAQNLRIPSSLPSSELNSLIDSVCPYILEKTKDTAVATKTISAILNSPDPYGYVKDFKKIDDKLDEITKTIYSSNNNKQ